MIYLETSQTNDWGQRFGTLRHKIMSEEKRYASSIEEAYQILSPFIEKGEIRDSIVMDSGYFTLQIVDDKSEYGDWEGHSDLWDQKDYGPDVAVRDGNLYFIDHDIIVDQYGTPRNDQV